MTSGKFAPQFWAAFAANIGLFGLGTLCSWPSPALPHLAHCAKTESGCDLPVELTTDQASWIGSSPLVGSILACFVVGQWMGPRLGCKWSMVLLSLPAAAGWALLLLPKALQLTTPTLFYIGRIITGFAQGSVAFLAPLYISEISETRYRGALAAMWEIMSNLGITVTNGMAINDAVPLQYITIFCLSIPIASSFAMLLAPESPVFLVSRGHREAARASLVRLRGQSCSYIDDELEDIERRVSEAKASKSTSVSAKDLFTRKVYLKPFAIVVGIFLFQQLSGINAYVFYLQDIFIEAGSTIDPGLAATLVALTMVLASGFSAAVVERLGRRALLITSSVLMIPAVSGVGLYFYLADTVTQSGSGGSGATAANVVIDSGNLGWLPLVCLVFFVVVYSVGFGPLPWVMNVELFPKEAQHSMASIGTAVNCVFMFVVSKFSPVLQEVIYPSGLFFCFAGFSVLGLFFVIFCVPETKGKTPEDMKRYYENGDQVASSTTVVDYDPLINDEETTEIVDC